MDGRRNLLLQLLGFAALLPFGESFVFLNPLIGNVGPFLFVYMSRKRCARVKVRHWRDLTFV